MTASPDDRTAQVDLTETAQEKTSAKRPPVKKSSSDEASAAGTTAKRPAVKKPAVKKPAAKRPTTSGTTTAAKTSTAKTSTAKAAAEKAAPTADIVVEPLVKALPDQNGTPAAAARSGAASRTTAAKNTAPKSTTKTAAKTTTAKATAAKTTAAKTTAAKTAAAKTTAAKAAAAKTAAAKATAAKSTAAKSTAAKSTAAKASAAKTVAAKAAASKAAATKSTARAAAAKSTAAKTAAAKAAAAKNAAAKKAADEAEKAAADAAKNVPEPPSPEAAPVDPMRATETAAVSVLPVEVTSAPEPVAEPAPEHDAIAGAEPEPEPVAEPVVAPALAAEVAGAEPVEAEPIVEEPTESGTSASVEVVEAEGGSDDAASEVVDPVDGLSGGEAITIRGLVKQFGDNRAVDGIDLTVPAGSFYGVVGPNGAGKTTTLSIVAGLLRADEGSVVICGIDQAKQPLAAKKLMGVLPDRLRTFDRLTGRQLLYYYGLLRGLAADVIEKRAADLARAFDLGDALSRVVSDYSAGMTKKIMLAGAMIHSPRVLVLDEPFESVDPVSSAVILDILRAYVSHGGTVILSSHGMDLVERVCSRVAIIVGGEVLAEGTVDDVRAGQTLEARFVELAGSSGEVEGLEWLHTFSD
ncbi:hypothetical protein MOX01_27140 [Microbacterium oxydans]|nr:hypothetical protein MOX01_27140 [Microbacterium oxydans]